MEYKAFQGGTAFKDVDVRKRIVTGYFASFGTVDRAKEVVVDGAFTKTIAETGPQGSGDIAHLQDHDGKKTVGVLQVLEQHKGIGLYKESKISRKTIGEDYLLGIEDGIIKNHSFGYRVIKSHMKDGIKYLTEIDMKEGSGLQRGIPACNPNTPVTGIKSLEGLTEEEKWAFVSEQLALYQKAWSSGKYSDEYFINTILPNLQAFTAEANNIIKSVEASEAEPITSKNHNPTESELKEIIKKHFTLK